MPRAWEQELEALLEPALSLWLVWSLRDLPSARQSALRYAKSLAKLVRFVLKKPRLKGRSSFGAPAPGSKLSLDDLLTNAKLSSSFPHTLRILLDLASRRTPADSGAASEPPSRGS